MSRSAHALSVPIAHAGPISEFLLEKIVEAGHLLQNDLQPQDSDLALILLTAPQIAAELLQRRRIMGMCADAMGDIDNVTFLPCR